jgi:hypothetical protein
VKDRATISKQQTQFQEILPRLEPEENVET